MGERLAVPICPGMRHRLPVVPALLGIGVVATLLSLLNTSNHLGSIPCVAAAGLLGLSIARWMERRGASRAACIATIVFSMVNPLTQEALSQGHPEELLGGASCAGAVLAAMRGRSTRAALLLGLALVTMQWALIAVLPVLAAAPTRRLRVAVVAGAIAAALTVPLVAGNLSLTQPLIVALALPLSAAWWFSRRRTPDDVLGLLALLFLLRCLLDPVDNAYHHVPFLLSLIAWEGLVRRGLPLVSILSSVTIYYAINRAGATDDLALRNAFYLAATVPVAVWLAVMLYVPRRALRRRVARRAPGSADPLSAAAGPFG